MTNPFPGIDPYVESQLNWQDFHTGFLTYIRDAINNRLPDRYIARMEERFTIVDDPGDESAYRADVLIAVDPQRAGRPAIANEADDANAPIEPVTITLGAGILIDEGIQRWVEIQDLESHRLITVIEVLSPTNKIADGRKEYRQRRDKLLTQRVHLVELDLLLGGKRLPMDGDLPPGDFFAYVSRVERRPTSDVYAWALRHALPTIPIPLAPPDPDIPLNLAKLYETAYTNGRYARQIRRDRSLSLPLSVESRKWLEAMPKVG